MATSHSWLHCETSCRLPAVGPYLYSGVLKQQKGCSYIQSVHGSSSYQWLVYSANAAIEIKGSLLVVMRHSVASKCPFCFQGHAAGWSLHAGSFMHFLLFHTRRTHMYTHSEKLHCINNIIHASTRCSPCLCSLSASTYHLASLHLLRFLFEIFKSFYILLLRKPILKVVYYSIVVANMYATVFWHCVFCYSNNGSGIWHQKRCCNNRCGTSITHFRNKQFAQCVKRI